MSRQFRFAVGSPDDLRSSLWTLIVTNDDAYLTTRHLRKDLKISLHASGRDRIAWNRESNLVHPATGDRAIFKWDRPDSWTSGWTTDLVIFVPGVNIPHPRPALDMTTKPVIWIEPPAVGHKVEFRVVTARGEHDLLNVMPCDPICAEARFKSGGGVVIVARTLLATPEEVALAQQMFGGVAVRGASGSLRLEGNTLTYFPLAGGAGGIVDVPLAHLPMN